MKAAERMAFLHDEEVRQWRYTFPANVFDNAGHGEGIGSRYFNVLTGGGWVNRTPAPDGRGSEGQTPRNEPLQRKPAACKPQTASLQIVTADPDP